MCEMDRRRLIATGALATTGMVLATASPALAGDGPWYVCAPCGCASDGVLFQHPGVCPSCGMTLVAFDPKAAPRHPGPQDFDACMRLYVEARRFSGAVLVARGAEVLFSKGYGLAQAEWEAPCTPAAKFRLGSLTKPFTATAVLQLVAAGALGLDDPICNHLKSCPAAWHDVKVSELLNHTSGIPDYLQLDSYWKDFLMLKTREQMVASFSGAPLQFPPGSRFSYSNSGYYLLGLIIENVSGQRYDDVLQKNILDPLGLADTGYDHEGPILPKRAGGYRLGSKQQLLNALYFDMEQAFANGGLYSTTGDLLKFARGGTKLLPTRLRAAMETAGKGAYGYGWSVTPAPGGHAGRQISHGGNINGFSAWLSRFPDEDVVLIVLSNLQDTNARQMVLDLYSVLHHEAYEPLLGPAPQHAPVPDIL